jgi:hypothetical protein
MKRNTGQSRPAGPVLAGLLALALGGCSDRIEGDVKKTLHSPGGGLTATLVRYESWKNILYRVYITRDRDESSDHLIFQISPGLEGPADIVWKAKDYLLIRVNCGDINIYRNNFDYTFIGLEGNRPCQDHPAHIKNS